ncbi:hypothetical protein LQZ19_00165 [Treponema primitia]|uniref:hypothetical protein n=1 Tax=Treponema primitia TaxID=88058 RepID=UPI00397E91C0
MASFIGYHGTDEYGARKIEERGFEDSPSESWLGPGIYFFETQGVFDGIEAAEWWVKTYKKYPRWVILKAEINSVAVMDLFGSKIDRAKFGSIKQKLLEKHLASGGKEIDFELKTVFMAINRKVDIIRCLVDAARLDKFVNFVVGFPQIQICVTKSGCISNFQKFNEGIL